MDEYRRMEVYGRLRDGVRWDPAWGTHYRLTPRQWRRIRHKANRAAKRRELRGGGQ